MVNELKDQQRLVQEAKKAGGLAFKTGAPVAGIPDLFIKLNKFHVVLIEVKKDKLRLSEVQRETLRRGQKAGLHCGWLVISGQGQDKYTLVGADPEAKKTLVNENCTYIPAYGRVWDIHGMVAEIIRWAEASEFYER